MLAEARVGCVVQAFEKANTPVPAERPTLEPRLVRLFVMQRSDALDSLPLTDTRGDAQAVLHLWSCQERKKEADSRGVLGRVRVRVRRQIVRLIQQATR